MLATELLLSDDVPREPASGEWWSRTPLAAGGALLTALANDAVTAARDLASAMASAGADHDLVVP